MIEETGVFNRIVYGNRMIRVGSRTEPFSHNLSENNSNSCSETSLRGQQQKVLDL